MKNELSAIKAMEITLEDLDTLDAICQAMKEKLEDLEKEVKEQEEK